MMAMTKVLGTQMEVAKHSIEDPRGQTTLSLLLLLLASVSLTHRWTERNRALNREAYRSKRHALAAAIEQKTKADQALAAASPQQGQGEVKRLEAAAASASAGVVEAELEDCLGLLDVKGDELRAAEGQMELLPNGSPEKHRRAGQVEEQRGEVCPCLPACGI